MYVKNIQAPQIPNQCLFFQCGPFLKSLLNLLQYYFCFAFWFLGHKAYGILVPQPEVELAPLA